jgi:tRNA 2-thiouridine synthesizing protein A
LIKRQEDIMSNEIKVDKTMDLKGLPCPQPVIKVSKGIKEIEVGQVLEAVTTDPGSLSDFPAWARTSGNEILKTDQDTDVIRFLIKRVK